MTYSVISTISPASSIHYTLKCNFTSTSTKNLIISKTHTLEIFSLTEFEILQSFKLNLYGRISNLLSYRPKGLDLDQLITLTEKNQLLSLQFNPETNQVITVSKLNLNNPFGKLNSNKSFLVISQEFRVLITSVYQGELGVIWFDGGGASNGSNNGGMGKFKNSTSKPSTSNNDSSNAQGTLPPGSITHRQRITLDQFEIHSLTILNNTKHPTIAVLYSDYSTKKYLKFYQLTKLSSKLTEVYGDREVSEDTRELIALPNGGLILVGSDSLIAYNANCSKEDQLKLNLAEPRIFTTFEIIDNLRILITDALGKLYLIKLMPTSSYSSQGYYKSVDLHLIGHTTISSSLTYLGNRFLFVGSNAGNSEVWKLPYKTERFTIYQSLDGLGPVTDLKYLKLNANNTSVLNEDFESNEPASLICTSGIGNNGTIRQLSTGLVGKNP
ncbi:hypothetical protein CONCODRAFT_12470 [Conidiobolus coronatus NRRL 28638]|uniref:RSE1/DDB1/CPSF1 first beta-propeller domain-containing protein n=1 Tax=Conidiobolus coronatus (strain ATCC 28846 / CBS 209.66 / NRRL 28638) TaxID=796925 RepID=A0A137NST4_CONC2|nr:hypothetical protein CONCODRAFT_12470 [Conidiobolus coronatus NRRL 28638]|eukprot:KXN65835.1 hypothetical protein CONCODRAFT_12470 [Conidiobolus coronatus NRRL 28638]